MLDIDSVKSYASIKVQVSFSGAPALQASYSDYTFLPDFVHLAYRYNDEDGTWGCTHCEVSGPRILKPGPGGEQRLGKDCPKRTWHCPDDLPQWLAQLIDELRPTGDPGMTQA